MSISKKDLASERRTRHCRKPQRCVYYAAGSILSCKVPTCPACGDIMDSVDQCPYCGQKFSPDDTVRERKKVSRMACLLCGTEHALVITRVAYNGHIRGVCEACGAKMMG